jgi:hypothetical protein
VRAHVQLLRSSDRHWIASEMCVVEISSAPSRSAMVRETFRMQSWARGRPSAAYRYPVPDGFHKHKGRGAVVRRTKLLPRPCTANLSLTAGARGVKWAAGSAKIEILVYALGELYSTLAQSSGGASPRQHRSGVAKIPAKFARNKTRIGAF